MFGKGSILTTFSFRILGQIVISLGALRLFGVTLGIPNLSDSFSPNNIYQIGSFLAHPPPNFQDSIWVDIKSIWARPSGTTPSK